MNRPLAEQLNDLVDEAAECDTKEELENSLAAKKAKQLIKEEDEKAHD